MRDRLDWFVGLTIIGCAIVVSAAFLWWGFTQDTGTTQELKDIKTVLMVLCKDDQYCQEFVGQIGR